MSNTWWSQSTDVSAKIRSTTLRASGSPARLIVRADAGTRPASSNARIADGTVLTSDTGVAASFRAGSGSLAIRLAILIGSGAVRTVFTSPCGPR